MRELVKLRSTWLTPFDRHAEYLASKLKEAHYFIRLPLDSNEDGTLIRVLGNALLALTFGQQKKNP